MRELHAGHDRTREVEPADLRQPRIKFTADAAELRAADFFIVTVPTPIDDARRPDLGALLKASETVGQALRKGAIVVYEFDGLSGRHRGGLRSRCSSRHRASRPAAISPSAIRPSASILATWQHRFETIKKVVAGQDAETLEVIAAVYGSVVTAGIHKAPSIKVAEAAKVIENTQRDLNIALMNELSAICHLLDIDTVDVLAAAQTKWNFLPFTPGLVGGHCIGVDPYYLTHRAEKAGYHPEVILAGRRINDGVGQRVARECLRRMMRNGSASKLVTILGLTFKENVPDVRNSKVVDIVSELRSFGATVQVHDPLATASEVRHEYGIELHGARRHRAGRRGRAGGAAPGLSGGRLARCRSAAQERPRPGDRRQGAARPREKPDGVELWRL